MKVQNIKNTFMQKSLTAFNESKALRKISNTPLSKMEIANLEKESAYYKSLALEARARLDFIKHTEFKNERQKIQKSDSNIFKFSWNNFKLKIKSAFYKFDSIMTYGDAYGAFPERFTHPDNNRYDNLARFYKY